MSPNFQIGFGYILVAVCAIGTLAAGIMVKNGYDKKREQLIATQSMQAGSKLEQNLSRPLLYIKPNKIEYSSWSEKEKLDDPEVTSRCEKIILYFAIHNNSKSAASNVDIKVTSSILQEKYIDKFNPSDIKNSYGHNLHFITEETPGRQPFILGLDKKFVKYFDDGTIKVKLIVNIKYKGLNDGKEYWSESAFIYSPTFEKQKEIYSKGN